MLYPRETDALLFLDETGTGNYFKPHVLAQQRALLEAGKKPSLSTIFGLGGVLFRRAEYIQNFAPEMMALRRRHFGRDDFLLHEFDLRAMSKQPYIQMRDEGRWRAFYDDFERLIQATDFRVIVATIDKIAMQAEYAAPLPPYQYSLHVILERVINERAFGTTCRVVAENREKGLNNELKEQMLTLQYNGGSVDGRPTVSREEVQARIDPTIIFRAKTDLDAGLEIADLCAGPVTRWLHGLKGSHARDIAPVVLPKLRCGFGGRVRGYGAKCLPRFPAHCPV